MALEGTIKDFGLPDIFQLIGLQRKTGILALKNESEDVTVTFENGMVVNADSSSKRLEDRLGNVIVKQGKITKERLDEALQMQRATLQRLGHILVANNMITPKDLKEALQVQISQIVFKVFRWRDGEYHFAPTNSVDYDRDNFTPMSADFILMEGIRMVDEWPIIEKRIPSMDIVFRPVVDSSLIEVGQAKGDDEGFPGLAEPKRTTGSSSRIQLTLEEEQVFRRIDGARTVQSIIDATGLGEFDVCRTLFELLNRNLIAPVGRGIAREAPGAALEPTASGRAGWAVAGLLLLVAVAGVVVQRTTPFGLTGRPGFLAEAYNALLDDVTHTRLERLDRAILAHHLAKGHVPRTLDDLVVSGLVDRTYLKDPWSRPYHFAHTENGYLLSAVDDAGKSLRDSVIERVLPPLRP
jgi:hypothetical protein